MSDGSCRIGQHGQAVVIDGTQEHLSEEFQGTRYSIVAFLHSSTSELSQHDKSKLIKLGFRLPQGEAPPSRRSQEVNRCLIEYWCGEETS
jgi:hypothetical protein